MEHPINHHSEADVFIQAKIPHLLGIVSTVNESYQSSVQSPPDTQQLDALMWDMRHYGDLLKTPLRRLHMCDIMALPINAAYDLIRDDFIAHFQSNIKSVYASVKKNTTQLTNPNHVSKGDIDRMITLWIRLSKSFRRLMNTQTTLRGDHAQLLDVMDAIHATESIDPRVHRRLGNSPLDALTLETVDKRETVIAGQDEQLKQLNAQLATVQQQFNEKKESRDAKLKQIEERRRLVQERQASLKLTSSMALSAAAHDPHPHTFDNDSHTKHPHDSTVISEAAHNHGIASQLKQILGRSSDLLQYTNQSSQIASTQAGFHVDFTPYIKGQGWIEVRFPSIYNYTHRSPPGKLLLFCQQLPEQVRNDGDQGNCSRVKRPRPINGTATSNVPSKRTYAMGVDPKDHCPSEQSEDGENDHTDSEYDNSHGAPQKHGIPQDSRPYRELPPPFYLSHCEFYLLDHDHTHQIAHLVERARSTQDVLRLVQDVLHLLHASVL